ncbi:hypothetical protein BN1013_01593 [Candidatus Rubidus massiliensis]|nr:hypothetical protein BN1013_01593 [Candidatus Rubidus massiliensis]
MKTKFLFVYFLLIFQATSAEKIECFTPDLNKSNFSIHKNQDDVFYQNLVKNHLNFINAQIENILKNAYLTDEEKETYRLMIVRRMELGYEELDKAEKLCWYLPYNSRREFISSQILHAITSLSAGTPYAVVFNYLIGTVGEYAAKSAYVYDEITEHLNKAKMHFSKADQIRNELFKREAN